MTERKFKPGDLVRVKSIRGPKMVIGSTWHNGNPPAYSCGWFTKTDDWKTDIFNESMLELDKGTE